MLHVFIAFDWGDEIHLEKAQRLIPSVFQELPRRRRRTPSSFVYRPAPLHVMLPAIELELPELGRTEASAGLTLFDFGAVSLAFRMRFTLSPETLLRLAGSLADPSNLVLKAAHILRPIFQTLRDAIHDPQWSEELTEEYFVFQFSPDDLGIARQSSWLAGLVHLENATLSPSEAEEALRLQLSYTPEDLFIPDWAAAALFDFDCDETLQAIEFANLQLLEFRHIDNRLDQNLAAASRTIHPLTRSALPFWRLHSRPLRVLGELKVEANGLFERTGNVLKLVGEPYLARVYRLVASRFHLETWEQSIQRKLDVAEGVYQVVSDQAAAFRMEFLEMVIIALIAFEILWTLLKPH